MEEELRGGLEESVRVRTVERTRYRLEIAIPWTVLEGRGNVSDLELSRFVGVKSTFHLFRIMAP